MCGQTEASKVLCAVMNLVRAGCLLNVLEALCGQEDDQQQAGPVSSHWITLFFDK